MPNDNPPVPKAIAQQVKEQAAEIAELKKAVKALLVAAKEWNDVTGRECMPEGNYLGEEF